MVKKILRYEWIATRRFIMPMSLAMIVIAILGRLLFLLDAEAVSSELLSVVISLGQTLAFLFASTGIAAVFLGSVILLVVRFYRSVVGGEGYFTMMIPVKIGTLILTKTLFAVLVTVWNAILTVSSLVILGIGTDTLSEILNVVFGGLIAVEEAAGGLHLALYLVEIGVMLLIGSASSFLLYAACISIGQLMQRHRVIGAVLAYGGWYMICRIAVSVLFVILPFVADPLLGVIEQDPVLWVHIGLLCGIAVSAALTWAFYAITRSLLTKRLNLE